MEFRTVKQIALALVPLALVVYGCAAESTSSLDSTAAGLTIQASPNTLGGSQGVPYQGGQGLTFSVHGGPNPNATYYWTVSGTVPPGLTVVPADDQVASRTLTISGTPTTSGHFAFKVSVHTVPEHNLLIVGTGFAIDIAGSSATIDLSPTSMFWPADLPNYTESLTAIGGSPPYRWSAVNLPGSLVLGSTTGTISGAAQPGTYEARVTIVDANGLSVTKTLKIRVVTVAEFKGTWTGILTAGAFVRAGVITAQLTGYRLSLAFNDQGLITQGSLHATAVTPGQPGTSEVFDFGNGYPGAFNGDVFQFNWHIACRPLDNDDLDCIGHYLDPTHNARFVLTRVSASDSDTTRPTVATSSFSPDYTASGGQETIVFSEPMSTGSALTVSGGTLGDVTFSPDGTTVTIDMTGLSPLTTYTLTLNPQGQTAFLDFAGNALQTTVISFTTPAAGANRPPTAQPTSVNVTQGVPRSITLAGSDPDGDALTFAIATSPSNGTLSAVTGTSVTYTPASGYAGPDSFTFTASDGIAASAPATVSITVGAGSSNQPPTATSQPISSVHGRARQITLAGTDPEDPPSSLTYTIVATPTRGTLSAVTGASVTYTPTSATYVGGDSFTFKVTDSGGLESAPATVSITLTNQAPTAAPQSVSVQTDTPKVITLAGSDPDGDQVSFAVGTNPTNGTLSAISGSTITYTPNSGYTGTDSFTFTTSDGIATSAPATVGLTVAAASQLPVADSQTVPQIPTRQYTTRFDYVFLYAITLTGSDPEDGTSTPPLRFKITQYPQVWDSTFSMDMVQGNSYRFWNSTLNAWEIRTATTSTTVNPATGEITVSPPGSPATIIYAPPTCHVDPRTSTSMQFTVTDSSGQESAPGTVGIRIKAAVCSHPP